MKNSLIKIWLLLYFVTLTNLGYSEVLHFADVIEAYNAEDIEYCVNPNDLALISGKLFLNCSSVLVPLNSLRYEEKVVFVTPKAYGMYKCPLCKEWVFIGHDCR